MEKLNYAKRKLCYPQNSLLHQHILKKKVNLCSGKLHSIIGIPMRQFPHGYLNKIQKCLTCSCRLSFNYSSHFAHNVHFKMTKCLQSLFFLFIFLSFTLRDTHALECSVSTNSWTTLTFKDLKQNGVIYSTCLTTPPGGRHFLLPTLEHLKLPPLAELMVYLDGHSLLIHHSCSVDCSASKPLGAVGSVNSSMPHDLLTDVQNLQLSLEREIINSEIFLASNEKIEERYKRSGFVNSQRASKRKRSDMKFEVKVDRKNIEKMTRLKEFASGKHSAKTEDNVKNIGGCSSCPSFKFHKLIELHLRLPRGLECDNNTGQCASPPELLLSVEMKEKALECDEGENAVLPLVDMDTKCAFSSASFPSPSCLVPSCQPSEGLIPIQTSLQKHLRHKVDPKKMSGKRKRKAKLFESVKDVPSTQTEFKISLLPTQDPKVCFWRVDTSLRKNLELYIPLVLLPHVNVYDGSLLTPKWKVEFCPVSNSSSFWLQATKDEVFIVYSNPYSLEKGATIGLSLHTGPCAPPPSLRQAKHWWESSSVGGRAVYSCAAELNIIGDAEVECDDAGQWSPTPVCSATASNKNASMSDDPESTTESALGGAVWLSNATFGLVDDGGNKSAKYDSVRETLEGTAAAATSSSSDTEASGLPPNSGTNGQKFPGIETQGYDNYYDEVDDYYSYNDTEYEYLPEFNATSFPVLPTSNSTPRNGSLVLFTTPGTEDAWGNYSVVDDVTDVRALLKALSIDENAIMYLVGGCCVLVVLLLVLIVVTCVVVRRRRYPDRVALGRKFDTFQNPIYEKTVVSVPIEGDLVDDEKRPPSTPPLAIKAEMEDLSDSTVMEQ